MEDKAVPEIKNDYRRQVTEAVLENTLKFMKGTQMNEGAPTNTTTGIANWSPVLIKMLRRAVPQSMAFDLFGVQVMTAPTQPIFALRSRYNSQTGDEALYNEANSAFSGAGSQAGDTSGFPVDAFGTGVPAASTTTGTGMALATGEALTAWPEMGFTIESISATAKTRKLKATLSNEMLYDLQNVHSLDGMAEITNILSNEVRAERDRECLRTMNIAAKVGATGATKAGLFDLVNDADGRWMVERFKGLLFQIEVEANQVAIETRMGKANRIICSSNVASALNMAGILQYTPDLAASLNVDPASATYAGVLMGKYQVFVDPYAAVDYVTVGYKGSSPLDAGIFMGEYLPVQGYEAKDPVTFNPVIGLSSRYAIVANPFCANYLNSGVITPRAGLGLGQAENMFFRKMRVGSLHVA